MILDQAILLETLLVGVVIAVILCLIKLFAIFVESIDPMKWYERENERNIKKHKMI